ncbi:MAG: DUF2383 domain-containing protein [Bdellovibrionota bacterium]
MKFITILSLLFSLSAIAADTKTPVGGTAKPSNDQMTQMDDLIRGEMSAVKAYDTVLTDMKAGAEKTRLQAIRTDHQSAVDRLSKYVAGKPDLLEDTESAGAWGTFATAWTKGAKLMGNEAALKALQTGEEHGIREYKEALEDTSIDKNLKAQIKSDMLPKQEKHIETLKTFM